MISTAITIFLILIIRDWLYRIFVIRPITNLQGTYARKIEDLDIVNWVKIKIKSEVPKIGFIGNSHIMDAIDPEIIARLTNKTAYNIALYYIPTPNILQVLTKFNCFPEVIFVDISTRYSMYNSSYNFYFDKITCEKNYNILKDRIAYLLPSLFVPKQFRPIELRVIKKALKFRKNSDNYIARYTPFRFRTSFNWALNKETNHRIVSRVRKISKQELRIYDDSLNKTIDETYSLCNELHENYTKSFEIWEQFLIKAKENNSKVVIIRLPMDKKLINFENENCKFYFDKIKTLCDKFSLTYKDLNDDFKHLNTYNFYIDGQHTTHSTAIEISNYLSKELIK